jgi:hypothetical protein
MQAENQLGQLVAGHGGHGRDQNRIPAGHQLSALAAPLAIGQALEMDTDNIVISLARPNLRAADLVKPDDY